MHDAQSALSYILYTSVWPQVTRPIVPSGPRTILIPSHPPCPLSLLCPSLPLSPPSLPPLTFLRLIPTSIAPWTAVGKQALALPGSPLFNLLGGALFGVHVGFPVCLACISIGTAICYVVFNTIGGPFVRRLFVEQLARLDQGVRHHRRRLFYYRRDPAHKTLNPKP